PTGRRAGILIELDISHPRTSYFYLRTTQQLRLFLEARRVRAKLYVGHAEPGSDEPRGTTCLEFIEDVEADRIAGLAAIGVEPQDEWARPLHARGVPVVGGSAAFEHRVCQDYEGLVREGVRELVKRGSARIALLGGSPRGAFESALREQGLPLRREWLGTRARAGALGAGHDEFARIWSARDEKPDGILVTDDMLLQDAVPAILSLGVRVPKDLVVVSHANRGGMPPLPFPATLLEFDPDAHAEAMGRMLAALLKGRKPKRNEVRLGFERVEAMCAAGLPRAAP
ncbi:MAG: substrate-binding domain-containing protein, partial [Planctomycetota bacterium]